MEEYSVVGKGVPRVDGVSKVTGEANFTGDIKLPGMLYGKILRSPYPHARILNIDTSAAERLRGVKAVITSNDTLKRKHGILHHLPQTYDDPIFQYEKVRYVGDAIAAVAAVDEDIAEEALDLIKVEYEPLPAVFDAEEAYKPDAPEIHDHVERNVCFPLFLLHGDIEKGFKKSDVIVEDRFETVKKNHCTLETYTTLSSYDGISGKLSIWTSTQTPFWMRLYLSELLDWPESRIRIIRTYVGGGFGSRHQVFADLFGSVLLSIKSGKPVRISYTREEQLLASQQKHPMVFYIKCGVKKDGTIQALDVDLFSNTGAYSGLGPTIALITCSFLSLTYKLPSYRFDGKTMYTNTSNCGPHRGFGNQQGRFAFEQILDILAERISMDPVELRLKNAVESGYVTPNEWRITSCGFKDCIESVRKRSQWVEKRGTKKENLGIGIGCCGYVSGGKLLKNFDSSGAFVKIEDDGSILVISGTLDMGQGSDTILSQIVAEEMGVELKDVHIMFGDTDLAPKDLGSYSSRVTVVAGNACKIATRDAKEQLLNIVADRLEANPDDLDIKSGWIWVKGSKERGMSFKDAVTFVREDKGVHILGRGYYDTPTEFPVYREGKGNIAPAYTFGAGVAEIKVDKESGIIIIDKITQAQDVGKAINPIHCEGQIEGSIAGAIGQLLFEEFYMDKGIILNPNLLYYKIPTSLEMPNNIEPILIETMDEEGPFGAKGMSESPEVPPIGAVANAIYDALGIRIKKLPITPERILRALEEERK